MNVWLKRGIWVALLALVVFGVVRGMRPTPVLVDAATIVRGEVVVSVDDDGATRVRERYVVSAPIAGRILRTNLDPGDEVRAGASVVAEFEPMAPTPLDARARGEAEARVRAAESAVEVARAAVAEVEVDAAFAARELERNRGLLEKDAVPQLVFDQAERDHRRAQEALRSAGSRLAVARHEAEVARATLAEVFPGEDPDVVPEGDDAAPSVVVEGRLHLRSPIDGVVLRVFEESARTVPAGTPLLEVGDLGRLEVVADYLSQDAVRVRPGMDVVVEGWGETGATLAGVVRRVEPGGFTKVSALGVEEQRVLVVVDPVGDEEAWARLGDGYRVELRIELERAADVLVVPTGALFREGEAWNVLVVEEGVVHARVVTIGRRSGLEAEVLSGLAEGETVVLYPSELVEDGTAVEVRS